MPIAGYQDFWIAGSRFYFVRDDDAKKSLIDLGVIETVNPKQELQTATLMDGDGGVQREVDEAVFGVNESVDIVTHNISPAALALWYMSEDAATFTQPATGISDVEHTAVIGPGKFVKIVDSSGNWLYNIATVTVEDATGVITFVEDTDYKVTDKVRGFIQILSGGSISDGDTIKITVTLTALTGNRLVLPQTARGAVKGHGMVVWGRGNNDQQTVREADMKLEPSDSNIQISDYSTLSFTAKLLSDITAVQPAGRLLQIAGEVPA